MTSKVILLYIKKSNQLLFILYLLILNSNLSYYVVINFFCIINILSKFMSKPDLFSIQIINPKLIA